MQFVASNFTNFGLIAVSLWLVWKEFRSGTSNLTTKMISDYKERNIQLEGILENERAASKSFKDEMTKVIESYKTEIAKLQASNDAKDQHSKDLKDLLLDKNPEVVTVLKEIRDSNRVNNESIAKVLGYQTEILEEVRDRGHKVDKASQLHIGDPMRVPPENMQEIL